MTGSNSFWLANPSTGFYNNVATRSLRFTDGSSTHLTFTPGTASSATDRRKVTHAVWLKRSMLSSYQTIYSSTQNGGGDYYLWRFDNDNDMNIILNVSNLNFGYDITAVFRDPSNWHHFVLIIDTTQSTDTDRVKLYVNGVLQTKTTKYSGGHVSQNFSTYVMDGTEDAIGQFNYNSTAYFDGYMCDFITTIGQDTSISDFGELKNGVWIAKEYSGSYGANGFRLQFNQTGDGQSTASSSTIGADTSGNDNHWNDNNLDTYDSNLPDSPENNFMTFNTLHHADTSSLSNMYFESNLHAHCDSDDGVFTTIEIPTSGKWYVELLLAHVSKPSGVYIMGNKHPVRADWTHVSSYTSFFEGFSIQGSTNKVFEYGGTEIGSTHSSGTIYAFLIDVDNSTYDIYQNDTKIWDAGTFNHPGATEGVIIGVGNNSDSGTNNCNFHLNAGQNPTFNGQKTSGSSDESDANGVGVFYYSTKGGLALCSKNLPDDTIGANSDTQADDHFDTILRVGHGTSGGSTSANFKADWIWEKVRNSAYSHYTIDSSRGIVDGSTQVLIPNTTNLETTGNWYKPPTSSSLEFNTNDWASSFNLVDWIWKANGGTTTTNDASATGVGTIDSVFQANTTSGFSIVTYTGTGSAGTVKHGLSVAPSMVIIKSRTGASVPNWVIGQDQSGFTGQMYFDTGAFSTNSGSFNNTAPTTSVVSIGTDSTVNQNTATYVMYCFANVEGYSKIGKYTGNGSTNGTFVYTGFRPAWVMFKRASGGTGDWDIYDSARDTHNVAFKELLANAANAESSSTTLSLDLLSNGFKLRTTNANGNANGSTYIFLAFAEQSFKFSNAR